MNRAAAYAEFDPATGTYLGWFRPVWKAEAETVNKDGKPIQFQSRKDAEIAAWRTKDIVEQPVMLRCGDTLNASARMRAESHFKPVGA